MRNRNSIRRLDSRLDCEQIVSLSVQYDFQLYVIVAYLIATFRFFTIPKVAKTLSGHVDRFAQTVQTIEQLGRFGYSAAKGRAAIDKINSAHKNLPGVTNEDYVYGIAIFVCEPILFIERFGWRKLEPNEQKAYLIFWQEVARLMNIGEMPSTLEELMTFKRKYEENNAKQSEQGTRLTKQTEEAVFGIYFKRFTFLKDAPFDIKNLFYCLLGEQTRALLDIKKPAWRYYALLWIVYSVAWLGYRLFPGWIKPVTFYRE